MTHALVGIVRWKRIGKGKRCSELVRKAVLASMADLANKDGGEIFASVPTIAALAGCSGRNVQHALAELEGEGLIVDTGERRPCRGGYTKEFAIVPAALEALPDLKKVVKPVRTSARSTGEAASPLKPSAEVVKPVRTSPEVVKGMALSGEPGSPKPLEPVVDDGEEAPAAPAPKKYDWEVVANSVGHPWLDPNKSQRLVSEGAIVSRWVRAGADLQLDVIPTIRDVLGRMATEDAPVHTWGYFDKAVRKATARRKRAELDGEPIAPTARNRHGKASGSQIANPEHAKLLADLRAAGLHDAADVFTEAVTDRSNSSTAIGSRRQTGGQPVSLFLSRSMSAFTSSGGMWSNRAAIISTAMYSSACCCAWRRSKARHRAPSDRSLGV